MKIRKPSGGPNPFRSNTDRPLKQKSKGTLQPNKSVDQFMARAGFSSALLTQAPIAKGLSLKIQPPPQLSTNKTILQGAASFSNKMASIDPMTTGTDSLMAEFLKLGTQDPNNDPDVQNALQEALSAIRDNDVSNAEDKRETAANKKEQGEAYASRMKNLGSVFSFIKDLLSGKVAVAEFSRTGQTVGTIASDYRQMQFNRLDKID